MLLTVSHGLLFDNSIWRRLQTARVFPSFNPAFCAGHQKSSRAEARAPSTGRPMCVNERRIALI
jgi:hypothetical protein